MIDDVMTIQGGNGYFDLVDQMHWEDLVDFETLESAGLENRDFDTVPNVINAFYAEEFK